MYYFNLQGGLGNQMFQYSAAKSLSLKTGLKFKVYFDDPYKFIKRTYALNCFRLDIIHADYNERPNNIITRLKTKIGIKSRFPFFLERDNYVFDPSFFHQSSETYYKGFWQNEKYFTEYRDIILNDFQLRKNPEGMNLQHLDHIKSQKNSISIHIRRGDYVQNPKASSLHGICSIEYYKKAINYFETINENSFYYCFSDDVDWVKENLGFLKNKIIIDNNSEQPEEDIRLMSNCKHHIIANSSFSWWGAWLNVNPNKIIIAPAKWSNIHYKPEIIPNNWITF